MRVPWILLLPCLSACATSNAALEPLLAAHAPWNQREGLASGPVQLARHHAVGQSYQECHRGQLTVALGGEPAHTWDSAFELDREVAVASTADGPFGFVRRGGQMVTALAGGGREEAPIAARTEPIFVQKDNAPVPRPPLPPPPRDASRYHFTSCAQLELLLQDAWPAGSLRAGDSWERTREITTYAQDDGTPTRQQFTTRWTLVGIEAGRFAHLRCEGTWRADGDAERDGTHVSQRASGPFACAARIDLRDGYSGNWSFVGSGKVSLVGTSEPATGALNGTIGAVYDIDIAPSSAGATPASCVNRTRAPEPP